ncbi:MAG: glucosidase [Candidatus Melainabacteria bacterium]|nr:glucosidase [Candidatus Melainabacteria bacterium]
MARKSKPNAEKLRLQEANDNVAPWRKWGPYLSERQWGTVREDYSDNGDAWNYFTHDHSRSRAYRWGEDGLGGICDEHQILCFALGLWNEKDPILKERLFGLTNREGNHGEDCKEYYFYLDSTPTHSYMKYLYKYTQHPFPYVQLIEGNKGRGRQELEYELLDTGVFDDDRYFDVFIEYAKESDEDILIKITAHNRGPDAAPLHLLPTFWFRNTWSWMDGSARPVVNAIAHDEYSMAHARHTDQELAHKLSEYFIYFDSKVPLLFTENDTNSAHLYGMPNSSPFVKDGINNYIVNGDTTAVNPEGFGTKMSAHYNATVPAGGSHEIRIRFGVKKQEAPMEGFDDIVTTRLAEADEFYETITPNKLLKDRERVALMRSALSGMLWGKQFFHYDVDQWLREHNASPLREPGAPQIRNSSWFHMFNEDIISMPDKWEYPWYAAWDLAFHIMPLNMVDPDFAKNQLEMMLKSSYLHPNGQIPAYEWNFGDVNPPVHAFATYWAYIYDKEQRGTADRDFLKYAFSKLLVNFTWWINRKDPRGHNVFEGGFLGLDNIGVFDRSNALPTGGHLEQADGTAWMVFFSQQMLNIALELAQDNPLYERFALKFFEHSVWISSAMDRPGIHRDELWDEEDGFFYDVLRMPNGQAMRLKVRSMVGLLPLASVVVIEEDTWKNVPGFSEKALKFLDRQKDICENIHLPIETGYNGRRMLAACTEKKLRSILSRMFDENEFLSPYGIRSLSRYHLDNPFIFECEGSEFRVDYVPGESDTGMFGGNSNWRGPIWMPVNFLLIRSLLNYYWYYGPDFKMEYPTGSGKMLNLFEITQDLIERLTRIFLRDEKGFRPLYGGTEKFQNDPHWRDLILFYEYFHGDNGAGLGASHQTGWTGLIAKLMYFQSMMDEETWLKPSPLRRVATMAEV